MGTHRSGRWDGRARRSPGVTVRRAAAGDAGRLTRVVRTSRAYEGPYASMVEGYRVGPDYIEAHRVFVAADDTTDRVLGFYALVLDPPELDLMFVADEAQGRGIGRLLAAHLREEARAAGLAGVRIVSHPPAEGFYRSIGAEPVGTVRADPPAVRWDRPELLLRVG
ncbi:GNAT family N-acetyltransferase [Streptomyces sp. 020-2-3H-GM]|uniref:GNAT family N-acetyltransferase n=1 Tax=Streptomyces sp. 020-2-3H-GM TaxID=2789258 RepID=UPI00397FF525